MGIWECGADNYTGYQRAMSLHKLWSATEAVRPWRSLHMNSSKYDDSISSLLDSNIIQHAEYVLLLLDRQK